jgi:hypothetical protein
MSEGNKGAGDNSTEPSLVPTLSVVRVFETMGWVKKGGPGKSRTNYTTADGGQRYDRYTDVWARWNG